MTSSSGVARPLPSYTLVVPTPEDFPSLAVMKDLAFAEKRGCASSSMNQDSVIKIYNDYYSKYPDKLQHCRVAKENETGAILGGCQLQLPGDPGDFTFSSDMRHHLLPGEAYVEWIGTHPDHCGKGIGSKLLAWAFETCEEPNSGIQKLTLEVMTANEGATRLYERKGFVIVSPDPHTDICDRIFTPIFLFLCLGCQYCSLTYMEKPITPSTTATSPSSTDPMNRS